VTDNAVLASGTFLTPEGALSLRLPGGWQWEQDSEDGHYLFTHQGLKSIVRLAETLHEDGVDLDRLSAERAGGYLDAAVPVLLNGVSARFAERVSGRLRTREWVASDGMVVAYFTHEVPDSVADAEDGAVDDLLGSLDLRSSPHPVIAALLERLNGAGKPLWIWLRADPLTIRCPEKQHALNIEPMVRSIDVNPARWRQGVDDMVRKIRNLDVFGDTIPAFEQVAAGLLPILRGDRVLESDGGALLRRPWAPGVWVYYALDVPGAFRFITSEIVAAWNVPVEKIEAAAVSHLTGMVRGENLPFGGAARDRILVLEDGEGLAASRLLIPRFRKILEERIGAEYVAAMPSAGVLIVRSPGFATWKEYLGEDTWEAYLAEPVPITPDSFLMRGDDVRVLHA